MGSSARIPVEILIGALEIKQLTPQQVLSILAYDTGRPDFHERIQKMAAALASPCGTALAELGDAKHAWLPKVRALARIAENVRRSDRIVVLDKAKRAARDCHDEFVLCGAAILVFQSVLAAMR